MTLRRGILLVVASSVTSILLVAATLQHIDLPAQFAVMIGLPVAVGFAAVLFYLTRAIITEFYNQAIPVRQLVVSLMIAASVSGVLASNEIEAQTLTWKWDVGPDAGTVAPVSDRKNWDETVRSAIEMHATMDPATTPFGVWRAEADLRSVAPLDGKRLDLWLTQPAYAVLDPVTSQPPPNIDGVDVTISIQRGQEVILTRQVVLDPPVTPDLRAWQHVVIRLPQDAERLVVSVEPRKTLDSDRLWVSTAIVAPVGNIMLDRVAIILVSIIVAATLVFAGKIPQVATGIHWMSRFSSHYGWFMVGIACLWLAYLLVWQRGLYIDDYSLKSIAVDLVTGERSPIFDPQANMNFPSRILAWIVLPQIAAMIPDQLLIARVIMAALTGINAMLLGYLVLKVVGSQLAAVIAGWGFLVHPHNEVPFWIGAGGYLLAMAFTLAALIAVWHVLFRSERPWLWAAGGIVALLLSYTFSENGVSILFLPPLFALVAASRQPRSIWRRLAVRTVGMTVGLAGSTFLYLLLIANNSAVIRNRQGIDLDLGRILDRSISYIPVIGWNLITWGKELYIEAFMRGVIEIRSSLLAILAFSTILILIFLSIVAWNDRPGNGRGNTVTALTVILLGSLWTITGLLFPYTLAVSQGFERRYAYPATAGLAVAFSGMAVLIVSIVRRSSWERVLIGASAVALLLASVCTLGFARTHAERSALDERQREALVRVAPGAMLPYGTFVVPYLCDERLFGQNDALSLYAFGAMETSWSAYSSLVMAYHRGDLVPLVTNRWGPMNFAIEKDIGHHPRLLVQNQPVLLDRLLLYQYREGNVYLITSLIVELPTGERVRFELPLTQHLVNMGAPGITDLVVQGVAIS